MRARALGTALLLTAVTGCGGTTTTSTAERTPAVGPHVVDYLVSLNSAPQYYTLDAQYADAQGDLQKDSSPSITWTQHVRTKEGVSYVSLVGSAVSNGQQPSFGAAVESPTVQCTIMVDGVQASTSSNPFAASCDVNFSTWKASSPPA